MGRRHGVIRGFIFVLFLLLCATAAANVSREEQSHAREGGGAQATAEPSFSLLSVCKQEAHKLCPRQEHAPLKCLLHHFASSRSGPGINEARNLASANPHRRSYRNTAFFNRECAAWLRAREECVSFVRRAGYCRDDETARECLRRIPQHVLRPSCRNSAYYNSVLLYGKMKQQQQQESVSQDSSA
ncbi:hypothetical protein, conserved [Trypanosoma brucei gambiense DAL972]|uniref:Enriched in surface-labeled proteome protein 18 n=1 Tax=Trypanosoma brucei gambiense (strain MHOM/CI/86/DAL972) TaxID=679716 RepID=D0A2N6_TRYB9|nr:hypothetical protein, conserved [Trypanosoma brucei gambiense DAL972]CBH15530.1 hypothetical protein, conserved [Trypanosoma brucei gambiense DAL972]|eukprot:XP_011777794.1 hypothetical protein, conserved [Trypanosoma brucei gambiense DAL972]